MSSVVFDPPGGDEARRKALYDGHLLILSSVPAAERMVAHGCAMLEEGFGGADPRRAQFTMPVEAFAAIVAPLKPKFIHHPDSWMLLAEMLEALGCDPETTYLDVPRLRISTSDGYLTSGVAYAHHPHRDTWYSAPMSQINWWVPLYEIVPENAMAFHPRYWSTGVRNDSNRFNYYEWNANQRKNAAQHVKSDTRWQPHALEPIELEPEIRLIPRPGAAIAFSGAQLHSTVPNTSGITRYSFDFRTVNIEDLRNGSGAPNVDSAPTGTSLRDFVRVADRAPLPEDLLLRYGGPLPDGAAAVFQPA
jgi:hypothetical protein